MLPQDYFDAIRTVLKGMEDESPFGLRGWKKYTGERGQEEKLITGEVARRLNRPPFRFNSTSEKGYGNNQACDVVFSRDDGPEAWLEAKLYYTYFFDDNDCTYSNPKAAYGSGTYPNKIRSICRDCRAKLMSLPTGTEIAGLLLGFEVQNLGPPWCDIERKLKSEMSNLIPRWQFQHLSGPDGWTKVIQACPKYRFVTRGILLTPS